MRRARVHYYIKGREGPSVFTLYVDEETRVSEISEDAKRYFRVRGREEVFISKIDSASVLNPDRTVIFGKEKLEFRLGSSSDRVMNLTENKEEKKDKRQPSKIRTPPKTIDKDLLVSTKMLLRDVFFCYTTQKGIVSTLNQTDWNHIMVPQFIQSKKLSNSIYDRVAIKKLLHFGSFLNAVSIVFRDDIERIRDEFALPLLKQYKISTAAKLLLSTSKTITLLSHLVPCLGAIFRSYLNLTDERRNVVQASIQYEHFEEIVSDLQLRKLASSRIIASLCLQCVVEEKHDVLIGVPWTRLGEIGNTIGSKRVYVTSTSFVSFLIRLSLQLSSSMSTNKKEEGDHQQQVKQSMHRVLYHIYQVFSSSSSSVISSSNMNLCRASMQYRKIFEQYYLLLRDENKIEKIKKTLEPDEAIKEKNTPSVLLSSQLSPTRRRHSSIVTGASLIASAENYLEQSNFEKASMSFLDAAQLHRDCALSALRSLNNIEHQTTTFFVTINEARRHLSASKSAFLKSIESTRQCHINSKRVKFLHLEIVSVKSVAEISLILARISLKYWRLIGGYRALIEIRAAISFCKKSCKRIFTQNMYDIDAFSIYIDSLLLEWKAVLSLWPWYNLWNKTNNLNPRHPIRGGSSVTHDGFDGGWCAHATLLLRKALAQAESFRTHYNVGSFRDVVGRKNSDSSASEYEEDEDEEEDEEEESSWHRRRNRESSPIRNDQKELETKISEYLDTLHAVQFVHECFFGLNFIPSEASGSLEIGPWPFFEKIKFEEEPLEIDSSFSLVPISESSSPQTKKKKTSLPPLTLNCANILRRVFDRYDTKKQGILSRDDLNTIHERCGFEILTDEMYDRILSLEGSRHCTVDCFYSYFSWLALNNSRILRRVLRKLDVYTVLMRKGAPTTMNVSNWYISLRSSLNRKKAQRKRASTIVLKLKESKLSHSPLRRSDSTMSLNDTSTSKSFTKTAKLTSNNNNNTTSNDDKKNEMNAVKKRKEDKEQHRDIERFTRFCDFFLVVGRGAPTKKSVHRIRNSIAIDRRSMLTMATQVYYVPQLLTRYPTTDYADTPLPELHLLLPFVHPLGIRLKHSVTQPRPTTFHFVLTDEKKHNLYGTVMCVYELVRNESECLLPSMTTDDVDEDRGSGSLWSPKSFVILSHWPFFSTNRMFLRQLCRLGKSNPPIPLERYISHFVTEIPLPPRGEIEIRVNIADSTLNISRPSYRSFPMVDVSFMPLLMSLSVKNIIKVFTCVLTEQKVVFVSSRLGLLVPVIEAVLSLLFPLSWTNPMIPIVPKSHIGIVSAPMSVLCGVHTSLFGRQRIALDFVCVNLDKDSVSYGDTELPDAGLKGVPMLQERARRKLETSLKKAVGVMHRDYNPCSADSCLIDMSFLFGQAKKIDSIPDAVFRRRKSDLDYMGTMFTHDLDDEDEDEKKNTKNKKKEDEDNVFSSFASQEWSSHTQQDLRLKVRVVFFDFMTQLLRGYRKHIKVRDAPQIFSTPTSSSSSSSRRKKVRRNTKLVYIDKRSFVRSSSYPELVGSLCDSQMFQHFLERLTPHKVDRRVQIFDKALKSNRSTNSTRLSSFPAFLSSSSSSSREKTSHPFTERNKVKRTFVVRPPHEMSSTSENDEVLMSSSSRDKSEFPFVEFPTLCPIKFGNPQIPKSFVRSMEVHRTTTTTTTTTSKDSDVKKMEEDEKIESLVTRVIVGAGSSTTMESSSGLSEDDDSHSSAQTTTAASEEEGDTTTNTTMVSINNSSSAGSLSTISRGGTNNSSSASSIGDGGGVDHNSSAEDGLVGLGEGILLG